MNPTLLYSLKLSWHWNLVNDQKMLLLFFCLNTSAASFTNHTEMQGCRLVDAYRGAGASPTGTTATGPMLEAKLMNLIKGRLQKFWLSNNFSIKFTHSHAPAASPDQSWYASDATGLGGAQNLAFLCEGYSTECTAHNCLYYAVIVSTCKLWPWWIPGKHIVLSEYSAFLNSCYLWLPLKW